MAGSASRHPADHRRRRARQPALVSLIKNRSAPRQAAAGSLGLISPSQDSTAHWFARARASPCAPLRSPLSYTGRVSDQIDYHHRGACGGWILRWVRCGRRLGVVARASCHSAERGAEHRFRLSGDADGGQTQAGWKRSPWETATETDRRYGRRLADPKVADAATRPYRRTTSLDQALLAPQRSANFQFARRREESNLDTADHTDTFVTPAEMQCPSCRGHCAWRSTTRRRNR